MQIILILLLALSQTGCQIGYLASSAYNQVKLLSSRQDMDEALKDPQLKSEDKEKILLTEKVRTFAANDLHLKVTKNYTRFVKLDRPYVTYVVNAAPKWELKHYEWSYPFVGKMPYRGYFSEQDAKEEEEHLKAEGYDTYMRGVSAFSTLGWFEDPLLSSMLRYSRSDLVSTLIHESVHTTLYIKNSADFNERMAVFLGNEGAKMFFAKEEGKNSAMLQKILLEEQDEKVFSEFIGGEIHFLEEWYKTNPEKKEELRLARFQNIIDHFEKNAAHLLKTDLYKKFPITKLNNARILLYKTYVQDLSDFQKLFEKTGRDFNKFIEACRSLESHPKPEQGLKDLIKTDN